MLKKLKFKKLKYANSKLFYSLALVSWLVAILGVNPLVVNAASTTTAAATSSAQSFIQSYGASQAIQQGIIVQLVPKSTNTVEAATLDNIDQTFGVVVNQNAASLALTNPSSTAGEQIFVTTSGHYDMLVSDENGSVAVGDYLTLSPLDGIAMKDNTSSPIVVGEALSSYNGTGPTVGSESVKESNGKSITVHFALIKTNIQIAKNPLLISNSQAVPRFLSNFSDAVAGKVVSVWRIYIGLAILAVIAFIVGSMLYGAVRNSLISIGRNPLSKKAITKGFIEVVLSALIIFISAVFGVYLLLKA